jgi:hypothetical protein
MHREGEKANDPGVTIVLSTFIAAVITLGFTGCHKVIRAALESVEYDTIQ